MKRSIILLSIALVIDKDIIAQDTYGLADFKSLDAILGTWKMETQRGPVFEQWSRANNEKLTGKSFRLNNQDTLVMERIELSFSGGNILYCPTVAGQNQGKAVDFKLVSNSNNRFVFENKNHDYPQRIIYHFVSKDTLNARIEGPRGGKIVGRDFSYVFVRE